MEFLAIFCAVALKGVILAWWESRKVRIANPGQQTIDVKATRYAPRW